jgi:hypothetical protein
VLNYEQARDDVTLLSGFTATELLSKINVLHDTIISVFIYFCGGVGPRLWGTVPSNKATVYPADDRRMNGGMMAGKGHRNRLTCTETCTNAVPCTRIPKRNPLDVKPSVHCGTAEINNDKGPSSRLCVLYLCQLATCEYTWNIPGSRQAFSGRPEWSCPAEPNLT